MAQRVKYRERPGLDPWVGKIPWRRKWQPTSVFLSGKSRGLRSLIGYSLQPMGSQRVGHDWVTSLSLQVWNCDYRKERQLSDTGWPRYSLDSGENWLKWKNFFSRKLQNQFFLHMQLKTSLLKSLPREKLEVNPFRVPEIHSPLCLRPWPWAN